MSKNCIKCVTKERTGSDLLCDDCREQEQYIDDTCPRCKCSLIWEDCEYCGGEGVAGHDCGEDSCCCLYPEDNMTCDICHGEGGWNMCMGNCDKNGKHSRTAAESE